MNRQRFLDRLAATERERRVAAFAAEDLHDAVRFDPTILKRHDLTPGDLRACQDHLDPTYLIRLFAEFESPLRLYWRDARKRRTWQTIRIGVLIDRVAAYQHVPDSVVDAVHEVREWRNALVHRATVARSSALVCRECRSRLCRFLSYLPYRW